MGGAKPADLAAYVDKLCGCAARGGRVVVGDDGRVVVADVATWTDDMSECVKGRFPGAGISINECRSSLSGFSVVIVTQGGGGRINWPAVACLSAMVACMAWLMLLPLHAAGA